MPRHIPHPVREKAIRWLQAGKSCAEVAEECGVSIPWVWNLRRELRKTPAFRPAPDTVPKAGGAVEGEAVEVVRPASYVVLSDGFLLAAAKALETAKDRHLSTDAWELVAALPNACRELVDLRRIYGDLKVR